MPLTIRDCDPARDLIPLTELLNRAYAGLAARGLRYVASHQTPDVTAKRIHSGRCIVAEEAGRLVGTITVRPSQPDADVPLYRENDVMIFAQFGVDPDKRGQGIGRILHDHAISHALARGAKCMALDTAAPATDLIELYRRWGYAEVSRHSWPSTNYTSVVMKKPLRRTGT